MTSYKRRAEDEIKRGPPRIPTLHFQPRLAQTELMEGIEFTSKIQYEDYTEIQMGYIQMATNNANALWTVFSHTFSNVFSNAVALAKRRIYSPPVSGEVKPPGKSSIHVFRHQVSMI